jgi:hypothetical protein
VKRLLVLALIASGCTSTTLTGSPISSANSSADAAADTTAEAASEASPAPATVNCHYDTYTCQEYDGVAPPSTCTTPVPGPCPPPADPTQDICVVGPGHREYYYHTIIPVDGGPDGGIPYGVRPPADCVHPDTP